MFPSQHSLEQNVRMIRQCSRVYAQRFGYLSEPVSSEYSYAEILLLGRLAEQGPATAAALAQTLDLDRGYLSRLLKKLERRRLIVKKIVPEDKRQRLISLSSAGKKEEDRLSRQIERNIADALSSLSSQQQQDLAAAMGMFARAFGLPVSAPA